MARLDKFLLLVGIAAIGAALLLVAQIYDVSVIESYVRNHNDPATNAWKSLLNPRHLSYLVYGQAAIVAALVLLATYLRYTLARISRQCSDALSVFQVQTDTEPGPDAGFIEHALTKLNMEVLEARRREKLVSDKVVDVICTVDGDGRIMSANAASERAWGYAPSELNSRPLRTLLDGDDSERLLSAIVRAAGGTESFSVECAVRRKDGTVINTMWNGQRSATDNGVVCIVRDVTFERNAERALQQSRERLQSALDALPTAVLITDNRTQHVEFANHAAHAQLGYQHRELFGKPVLQLIDVRAMGDSLDGKPIMVKAFRRDGFQTPVEVHRFAMQGSDENKTMLVFLDKSAHREVESLRREFTETLMRDFKEPLTSIAGMLALFERNAMGELSDKGLQIVRRVRRESDNMLRLMTDMLELRQFQSGYLLECKDMALDMLITQVVHNLRPLAQERDVDLNITGVRTRCWGDEHRIGEVLSNLITHAINSSPPRGRVLVIIEENGEQVRVSVTDQGRGLPADKLEKVFEPFQQIDVGEGNRPGTGLELAICKAIIEQHEGTIEAASTVGSGSRFTFTISRVKKGGRVGV